MLTHKSFIKIEYVKMASMLYIVNDYVNIITCNCFNTDDYSDASILSFMSPSEKAYWTCCAWAITPFICACVIGWSPCFCCCYVCNTASRKIERVIENNSQPNTDTQSTQCSKQFQTDPPTQQHIKTSCEQPIEAVQN